MLRLGIVATNNAWIAVCSGVWGLTGNRFCGLVPVDTHACRPCVTRLKAGCSGRAGGAEGADASAEKEAEAMCAALFQVGASLVPPGPPPPEEEAEAGDWARRALRRMPS